MNEYPLHYYIGSGKGSTKTIYPILAFEDALNNAGIAGYNLLKISSRLPAGATQSSTVDLKAGSLLPTAFARNDSNEAGKLISTAVGAAIPKNKDEVGIIMEYSSNYTAKESEDAVRKMIDDTMNKYGIEYDDIILSSAEAVVPEGGVWISLVSAISIW